MQLMYAVNSARQRRLPTRRAVLRWTAGSVVSLAWLPRVAAAQAVSEAPQDAAGIATVVDPIWATTISEASLRSQPDIADNRFGFARPGTPLQILGYEGDWAYVYNPHTQGTAYVSSILLGPGVPPSAFTMRSAPPVIDTLNETIVLTQDSVLAAYPSASPEAVFTPLGASTLETAIGTVRGDDGNIWYQTSDFYYIPSTGIFRPGDSGNFTGRWLEATLLPTTRVVAYEGQTPVRRMPALRGIQAFPTPTGVFSIMRRVPNETMDSLTVGIPRTSPFGYYVKNVLWTQYFTPDGASLHDNYWSSNFGGMGSHGCLGLSLGDSKWLWDWADIGTPVVVNAA